jgi:hypothetical protein
MSNSFWNFVTQFVPGGLAKAEEVNTNLTGIAAGLDLVETELGKSLQVTNAAGVTDIVLNAAARAGKLISFDINGDLAATTIMGDWKGDHADASGTDYQIRDVVRDSQGDIDLASLYICIETHTSTGNILADTAKWELLLASSTNIAENVTLDNTGLIVVDETNVKDWILSADAALYKARGTGVTSTYVNTATPGGTTFDQAAVNGEMSSDEGYASFSYAGATGVTVSDLTASSTWVYIDSSGNLGQQTTIPTRQDRTRKAFTMRIGVNAVLETIIGFEYYNNPIGHYTNTMRDIYEYLRAAGVSFRKEQIITGRADLGFDVSAGSLLELGGTGNIFNPNEKPFDAATNVSYNLMSRTAFVSAETELQKVWDNAESITALGSTTFVGHRLYRFSSGNFAMQYGQGNYANLLLAKAGVLTEEYVLNPVLKDATFFGWWIVSLEATTTNGTTQTSFREYTIGLQGGSSSSLSGAVLRGNNGSDFLDLAAVRANLSLNLVLSGTTVDLIASTESFDADEIAKLEGYTTKGDGGGAHWQQNGVTGQTASQSPAQLGYALLNDGNGNQWSFVGKSLNVLNLGALVGGVSDSLSIFSAAGNSGFKNIYVSGGQFLLSGVPTTSGGVTWHIGRGVSFTGAGKIQINASKDKILSNGDYRSIESDSTFYEGIFGYLEQNSASTAYGNLGVHGSVYTSWQTVGAAGANIALSGFAANDLVANIKGAWAMYGTAVRQVDVTGPTFGLELDIANMGNTVQLFPHDMFGPGQTQTVWLGSGGEISETASVSSIGTASCAIGIISNDPAGDADFDKGIVFGSKSLSGTDGDTTGIGIAIALSTRHAMSWYNTGNTKVGEITSTNSAGTNRQRIDFSAFGLTVVDITTAAVQLQIDNNSTAVNKIVVKASNTGAEPEIETTGSDTNIDLKLSTKGTGKLKLNYTSAVASTPANFTADRYLEIKDGSGNTLYLPVKLAAW